MPQKYMPFREAPSFNRCARAGFATFAPAKKASGYQQRPGKVRVEPRDAAPKTARPRSRL